MYNDFYQYSIRRDLIGGLAHYFVSFADGQSEARDIEITRKLYLEFRRFIRKERNLMRFDERYAERSQISDVSLHKRAVLQPETLDDIVADKLNIELIWKIVATFPKIQQRRFVLYYKDGLTYEQIAESEGCTKRAVKFSVDIAEEKIKKILKI